VSPPSTWSPTPSHKHKGKAVVREIEPPSPEFEFDAELDEPTPPHLNRVLGTNTLLPSGRRFALTRALHLSHSSSAGLIRATSSQHQRCPGNIKADYGDLSYPLNNRAARLLDAFEEAYGMAYEDARYIEADVICQLLNDRALLQLDVRWSGAVRSAQITVLIDVALHLYVQMVVAPAHGGMVKRVPGDRDLECLEDLVQDILSLDISQRSPRDRYLLKDLHSVAKHKEWRLLMDWCGTCSNLMEELEKVKNQWKREWTGNMMGGWEYRMSVLEGLREREANEVKERCFEQVKRDLLRTRRAEENMSDTSDESTQSGYTEWIEREDLDFNIEVVRE